MTINGREYEIIKIYKKKHELQDVYLLKDVKTGVNECFNYFDIKNNLGSFYSSKRDYNWTEEEDNLIKEKLLEGMTAYRISKELTQLKHTTASIVVRANNIKREMMGIEKKKKARKSSPRFNIKF